MSLVKSFQPEDVGCNAMPTGVGRQLFEPIIKAFKLPPLRPILASLIVFVSLAFGGCAGELPFESPNEDQRRACGLQCLNNGQSCSQFYARINEAQRLDYEKAKENYWICLRKYPGAAGGRGLCITPLPKEHQFDQCGPDLDACLEQCGTHLQELEDFQSIVATKQPLLNHQPMEPPSFNLVPLAPKDNQETAP